MGDVSERKPLNGPFMVLNFSSPAKPRLLFQNSVLMLMCLSFTCYAIGNRCFLLKYFSRFVFVQAKHYRKIVSCTFSGAPDGLMAVLDVTVKRLVVLVISVLQRMASALVLKAEGEGRIWSEGVVISAKTNRVRL